MFKISQPLYEQVYKKLKESILSGELKPGSKVVIARLAEKFQISRTPLREALRQLQSEGLLVQKEKEVRVVPIDKKDFEDLCACRVTLEKEIMTYTVMEISQEQILKAENLIRQASKVEGEGKYLDFMLLNAQFHDVLIDACSNKRLIQLLTHIRSLLLIYRANVLRKNIYNHEITTEHFELIEAIKSRDEEKAVKLIESHILRDLIRGRIFQEEIN